MIRVLCVFFLCFVGKCAFAQLSEDELKSVWNDGCERAANRLATYKKAIDQKREEVARIEFYEQANSGDEGGGNDSSKPNMTKAQKSKAGKKAKASRKKNEEEFEESKIEVFKSIDECEDKLKELPVWVEPYINPLDAKIGSIGMLGENHAPYVTFEKTGLNVLVQAAEPKLPQPPLKTALNSKNLIFVFRGKMASKAVFEFGKEHLLFDNLDVDQFVANREFSIVEWVSVEPPSKDRHLATFRVLGSTEKKQIKDYVDDQIKKLKSE